MQSWVGVQLNDKRVHKVIKKLDSGKLQVPGDAITSAEETSSQTASVQNPPLFQQKKTSFKDKGEAFHPVKQCIWREKDFRATSGESAWELVLGNIQIKTVT